MVRRLIGSDRANSADISPEHVVSPKDSSKPTRLKVSHGNRIIDSISDLYLLITDPSHSRIVRRNLDQTREPA